MECEGGSHAVRGDCMKYFKAGLAAAVVIAFGAISFRVALAQQGPGSDSSETVARPRKKNPPRGHDDRPEPTTRSRPHSAIRPAPTATNDEPAVDEPKIPSKFSKKDKEVPEDTPTFSSDVNTVELDVAVLDNKGHFLPGIPQEQVSRAGRQRPADRSRASTSTATRR